MFNEGGLLKISESEDKVTTYIDSFPFFAPEQISKLYPGIEANDTPIFVTWMCPRKHNRRSYPDQLPPLVRTRRTPQRRFGAMKEFFYQSRTVTS